MARVFAWVRQQKTQLLLGVGRRGYLDRHCTGDGANQTQAGQVDAGTPRGSFSAEIIDFRENIGLTHNLGHEVLFDAL